MRSHISYRAAAFLGAMPAALLGVLIMALGQVPASIWLQHLAASLIFPLLLLLPDAFRRFLHTRTFACVCVLLLISTLFFPGAEGIHRWLRIGPLNIHAAMLLLPTLLLFFSQRQEADKHVARTLLAVIVCVLMLQSDLSQLSALYISLLILGILQKKGKKNLLCFSGLMVLCLLACALRGQTLEPVPYCEGILAMAGSISPFLFAASVIALLLLPLSLIARSMRNAGHIALVVYYFVLILFALSGGYPMPIMGFGLSPIAGYWLAASFEPH